MRNDKGSGRLRGKGEGGYFLSSHKYTCAGSARQSTSRTFAQPGATFCRDYSSADKAGLPRAWYCVAMGEWVWSEHSMRWEPMGAGPIPGRTMAPPGRERRHS